MEKKRILIVDDEPAICHSLSDYLTEYGYHTTTAYDGAQGLSRARAQQFHVVLVDLNMPGVDGLEVIATLKAEQPQLPLVVVSGTGVLSDAVEAMRRGAWDYISKPVHDIDEIAVVIERVLERVQLRTERDRYQRELEQLNRSLEGEVALQTQDLQRANVKLERAVTELRRLDTLRGQFIQNVAHELRTPLALVHGYIEMLVQGDLEPDEQATALTVISRRVKILVDLVESITTLQNLDSQPLRIEQIKPADFIQTAMRMSAQRASSANIELQSNSPPDLPSFSGDFTRLAQALHQLIDNACKFSPEDSTVTINAQATPDIISISITDQGIGIPPEELTQIFDRFYQVDGSTRRRYGGTGLGLAIAKEIVEGHGGRITVESAVHQGSTFSIQLPRKTA